MRSPEAEAEPLSSSSDNSCFVALVTASSLRTDKLVFTFTLSLTNSSVNCYIYFTQFGFIWILYWFDLHCMLTISTAFTNERVCSRFIILLKLNQGQFSQFNLSCLLFLIVIRVSAGFRRLLFDLITGIRLDDYVFLQNGYDVDFQGYGTLVVVLSSCLLDTFVDCITLN